MSPFLRPKNTPQTPTFEGRPLARPTEDLEDQGLSFDLGTLINRRKAFGVAGLGASALVLAACSAPEKSSSPTAGSSTGSSTGPSASGLAATADQPMPSEMAGPFPGDGSNGQDVLEMTGVERKNITTNIGSDQAVEGVPLTLTMQVLDLTNGGTPLANAAVYIWQCDAQGNYSMYTSGYTDQTWLRGVQVTDAEGKVTFETIVPGCYPGRWPHIHFEVFSSINDIVDSTKAILTSQMALAQDVCDLVYTHDEYAGSAKNLSVLTIDSDMIFSDGWDRQMLTLTGSADKGYTSEVLPIPVQA